MFLYFRKLSSSEVQELKEKQTREVRSEALLKEIQQPRRKLLHMQRLREILDVRRPKSKDIWTIKKEEEGVYNIDVASLMMKEPVIVAGEEGRYILSLSSAFQEGKVLKQAKQKK